MSNRESLKRYGFCLPHNKYNFIFIKLHLESTDEDFKYREYIIKKFFSVISDSANITSKFFKIYY